MNLFLPRNSTHKRWPLVGVAILVFILFASILIIEVDARRFAERVYPGVSVGGISIGGKTKEEAQTLLEEHAHAVLNRGFPFATETMRATITSALSAAGDLDFTYEIVRYDLAQTVADALEYGKEPNILDSIRARGRSRTRGIDVAPRITIDQEKFLQALRENFDRDALPAQNARFVYVAPESFLVEPEQYGEAFDYAHAMQELERALLRFSTSNISLRRLTDIPQIHATDIEPLIPKAESLLRRAPIVITQAPENEERRGAPQQWNIDKKTLGALLVVKREGKHLAFDINKEALNEWTTTIAPDVEREVRNAKFVINNGRVKEFQSARDGITIDRMLFAKRLETLLNEPIEEPLTIELPLTRIAPDVPTAKTNDLGIRELIGVGYSNFAGSPKNRRHNIRVGAEALHGILIKPDEEFSLVKALGPIEKETGYLPELVIKGNRTIPEYGGGLCQIGTTTFRAAIESGLPITERRNHSYSVSYYLENGKPGTDATIYPQHPDMRFLNDTGNHILIQTRIEGDHLYFEFWGTRDGRTAERTVPVVSNIQKPPPTNIIETEDLPRGEKKCTERAHNGMTAIFSYLITYADGTKNEQTFRSVYRPWQEVCLVGKAPDDKEKEKDAQGETALPSIDTEGAQGD